MRLIMAATQLRGLPRQALPEHAEVPHPAPGGAQPHRLHRLARLQDVRKGKMSISCISAHEFYKPINETSH